ncbi:hypothetical protein E1B28_000807 [Marasmius oreades]|uniref:Uncharacterized protein n=1 Tax=Marasmius oreades TaxID=181124 RepID=A0A9P8AER3_9AGAR|nr:uncharacterized protein E1B28_000807 [Marasmius oreades]KAG7098907.1 hypothetical protein E1B28_000807 [Marasmius oreades]
MLMRFHGGGIGHKELNGYLKLFEKEAGLDTQVLPQYDDNGKEVSKDVNMEVDGPDGHVHEDEAVPLPATLVEGSERNSSDEDEDEWKDILDLNSDGGDDEDAKGCDEDGELLGINRDHIHSKL